MERTILKMEQIEKSFPGVKALDGVTFEVKEGEIHALVGENGAGKSTLMKILSGVYPYGEYQGKIIINGRVQKYRRIKDGEKSGVGIIYQELALVKQLNICENIFLGSEIHSHGIIDWDRSLHLSREYLKEVGFDIDPLTRVANLGVGQQQLVEIAKALSKKTKILILDEPTAALTTEETRVLLDILKRLRAKGVTCIYISHRLEEVFEVADRITVLRDGKTVVTKDAKEIDQNQLISYMVGREITQLFPKQKNEAKEVVLEIKDWTVFSNESNEIALDHINFQVRKGEVLGIAGLVGSGRTELMMSLLGAWGKKISGEIYLEGKALEINSPHDAIAAGISLASEDRKRYGLVLPMTIEKNVTLSSLENISAAGIVIDRDDEFIKATKYVEDLKIKTPSVEQIALNLSGGNQQKVVLGKCLMTGPKVLILDEPTRGIDVGAKVEIYNIMNQLVAAGVCVLMISSELPEILGMSDRILVMADGKITGELSAAEANQESIMRLATKNN